MLLSESYYKGRKLENLVENKTSYTLDKAALHVFETHTTAESVQLAFDQPVLASMLTGKKIMHLRDHESFNFLPGESLILPSNELMCIDFPEAKESTPTQCLAMAIDEQLIKQTITFMNESLPKADRQEWTMMDYNFHFTHDPGIYQILKRLLFLFTENHASKDYFVDNMLRELIIRILQANNRKILSSPTAGKVSDNRIKHAVRYIRENLSSALSVDDLSQKACMSPSHFYRTFKNEMGMSPVDFINDERIRLATRLLMDPRRKIKEVFMECGFESRSYFNRVFKKKTELSPREFQERY